MSKEFIEKCIEAPETGRLVSYLSTEKLAEKARKFTLAYGRLTEQTKISQVYSGLKFK